MKWVSESETAPTSALSSAAAWAQGARVDFAMAHEHVRVDEQALEDEGVVFVAAADVDLGYPSEDLSFVQLRFAVASATGSAALCIYFSATLMVLRAGR